MNKKNGIPLAKIPVHELGKNIAVAKCQNCGNDAFNVKFELVNQTTMRQHSLRCTDCKYEIVMDQLNSGPIALT